MYFDLDSFLHVVPNHFESLLVTVIIFKRTSPVLFLQYTEESMVYNGRGDKGMRTRTERAIRMATPCTQWIGGPAWPSGPLDVTPGPPFTPIARLE